MTVGKAELRIIEVGGDARVDLLSDGNIFQAELDAVLELRKVTPEEITHAKALVDYFSLDEREVEHNFFVKDSPEESIKDTYFRDFTNLAEHLTFIGNDNTLDDLGWRLRWGANVGLVKSALAGVNYRSAEGVLDGRAHNLKAVMFNLNHDFILQQHGIMVRALGLYPSRKPSN
jgi:hypothetical protein